MTPRRVVGLFTALVTAGALVGGLLGAWREHAITHALDTLSDD